eukprot:7995054-Alexandrium_andersonii.AAC.1
MVSVVAHAFSSNSCGLAELFVNTKSISTTGGLASWRKSGTARRGLASDLPSTHHMHHGAGG